MALSKAQRLENARNAQRGINLASQRRQSQTSPNLATKLGVAGVAAQGIQTAQGNGASTSVVGGGLTSGISGATAGERLGGGTGAVIGGTLGAAAGILGASAKRKQQAAQLRAKAEATKFAQLQQIESNKETRIQGALQNMRQAFSNALRVPQGINLGGR